jgi:hypothetical protein
LRRSIVRLQSARDAIENTIGGTSARRWADLGAVVYEVGCDFSLAFGVGFDPVVCIFWRPSLEFEAEDSSGWERK